MIEVVVGKILEVVVLAMVAYVAKTVRKTLKTIEDLAAGHVKQGTELKRTQRAFFYLHKRVQKLEGGKPNVVKV